MRLLVSSTPKQSAQSTVLADASPLREQFDPQAVAETPGERKRLRDWQVRNVRDSINRHIVTSVLGHFFHMNRVRVMRKLAASLAHEITESIASARNNALAAQNFLDKQPPELEEVREALHAVLSDVDRAGDIIDRIRERRPKKSVVTSIRQSIK